MWLPTVLAAVVCPERSRHLPSLSQICLYSKEIHWLHLRNKKSSYTLQAGHAQIQINRLGCLCLDFVVEWGWQVMTRIRLNPWEILWTLLLPMSQWLGPLPLSQGKNCTFIWLLHFILWVACMKKALKIHVVEQVTQKGCLMAFHDVSAKFKLIVLKLR